MDTPSSALEDTIEVKRDSMAHRATRQLALNLSGGSQLTLHEQKLLRVRLKIAALVLFIGFALFLLIPLLGLSAMASDTVLFIAQINTTAVLGLCAFSLCQNCPVSKWRLRVEEAIVFGMPASFFAMLNVTMLRQCAAEHAYLPDPFAPWIVLLFTYALFIPNRFRRAAVIIPSMAMAPVIILGVMMLTNTVCQQAHNADWMFFMKGLLLMVMSAIIGTTGAAGIGSLRKEAFTAKQLGQYRLIKLIGRGGMGEVHLAEHQFIKRPCALKVIRPEKAQDPQAIARFEREVQAAAKLTHWNSVNVYDYGHHEDGTFYFVMEHLPGMSLKHLVEQSGPIPAGRAIYFLRQVCGALQEAHDMNLIHRDLKPSNIIAAHLGGEHDVAKLLDFGLVKDVSAGNTSELTIMGTIAGSPLFMAPESATGDEPPDARSDIYSLGCVAYFLVTGEPPFPGKQPLKVLIAHAKEEVRKPSQLNASVPSDLEQLILMCLSKNPDDRPQSAGELEVLLSRCKNVKDWDRVAAKQWWSSQVSSNATAEDSGELSPTLT